MVVAFSTIEIRYIVSGPFDDLVDPFSIYCCDIKFLAALFTIIRPQNEKGHAFA